MSSNRYGSFKNYFADKIKIIPNKLWHYPCVECGKEYESTDPQITLYCSRECEKTAKEKNDFMAPEYSVKNPYDLEGVETHVCIQCREHFVVNKGSDKVFCSPVCENRYANEHKLGEKSVCKNCGKDFYRLNKLQGSDIFCSNNCKYKFQYSQQKKDNVFEKYIKEHGNKRKCSWCGQEYELKKATDLKRIYCSKKCQRASGQYRFKNKEGD